MKNNENYELNYFNNTFEPNSLRNQINEDNTNKYLSNVNFGAPENLKLLLPKKNEIVFPNKNIKILNLEENTFETGDYIQLESKKYKEFEKNHIYNVSTLNKSNIHNENDYTNKSINSLNFNIIDDTSRINQNNITNSMINENYPSIYFDDSNLKIPKYTPNYSKIYESSKMTNISNLISNKAKLSKNNHIKINNNNIFLRATNPLNSRMLTEEDVNEDDILLLDESNIRPNKSKQLADNIKFAAYGGTNYKTNQSKIKNDETLYEDAHSDINSQIFTSAIGNMVIGNTSFTQNESNIFDNEIKKQDFSYVDKSRFQSEKENFQLNQRPSTNNKIMITKEGAFVNNMKFDIEPDINENIKIQAESNSISNKSSHKKYTEADGNLFNKQLNEETLEEKEENGENESALFTNNNKFVVENLQKHISDVFSPNFKQDINQLNVDINKEPSNLNLNNQQEELKNPLHLSLNDIDINNKQNSSCYGESNIINKQNTNDFVYQTSNIKTHKNLMNIEEPINFNNGENFLETDNSKLRNEINPFFEIPADNSQINFSILSNNFNKVKDSDNPDLLIVNNNSKLLTRNESKKIKTIFDGPLEKNKIIISQSFEKDINNSNIINSPSLKIDRSPKNLKKNKIKNQDKKLNHKNNVSSKSIQGQENKLSDREINVSAVHPHPHNVVDNKNESHLPEKINEKGHYDNYNEINFICLKKEQDIELTILENSNLETNKAKYNQLTNIVFRNEPLSVEPLTKLYGEDFLKSWNETSTLKVAHIKKEIKELKDFNRGFLKEFNIIDAVGPSVIDFTKELDIYNDSINKIYQGNETNNVLEMNDIFKFHNKDSESKIDKNISLEHLTKKQNKSHYKKISFLFDSEVLKQKYFISNENILLKSNQVENKIFSSLSDSIGKEIFSKLNNINHNTTNDMIEAGIKNSKNEDLNKIKRLAIREHDFLDIPENKNKITLYRESVSDGNSFYRMFIFSLIEHHILNKNLEFVTKIFKKIKDSYFSKNELNNNLHAKNQLDVNKIFIGINIDKALLIFNFILNHMRIKDYENAYKIFLNAYNESDQSFDQVILIILISL